MALTRTTVAVVSLIAVMLTATTAAVVMHGTRARPPRPILGLVHDASLSSAHGCGQLADLVRRELPGLGRHPRARVLLLTTGDDSSANEPRFVTLPPVPRRHARVLEKGSGERSVDEYLTAVKRGCQQAPVTDRSPIYLGVKRGLEQVRADRGDDVRRTLIARTDLRETVEPALTRAMRGDRRAAARIAGTLDNTGVAVVLCGYAETIGVMGGAAVDGRPRHLTRPRSARDSDRLIALWRSAFTVPDLVTFEPFCLTSTDATPE
jgi:hypothetical protein